MSTFRSIYHCPFCGNKWKGKISRSREAALNEPVPKCPNLACGESQTPLGMDIASGKAPAQVGQNPRVNAIDETAKIVMQDHHMTDLRTDVREHEDATPKLAPRLQHQADNFFGGGRRAPSGTIPMRNPLAPAIAQAAANALSGYARQDPSQRQIEPLSDTHRRRIKTPIHSVNRDAQR